MEKLKIVIDNVSFKHFSFVIRIERFFGWESSDVLWIWSRQLFQWFFKTGLKEVLAGKNGGKTDGFLVNWRLLLEVDGRENLSRNISGFLESLEDFWSQKVLVTSNDFYV